MQEFEKLIPHMNIKIDFRFPVFNTSGILETSEMRIQVLEDLFETYPGMKQIEKIYSAKFGEIDLKKFHESCKNHEITLSLAKSNFNKVIGFLCPMKHILRTSWTKVAGGKTKIIFFDDQKMKKCLQREDKEVEVYSFSTYVIGLKDSEFDIRTSKNPSFA